MPPVNKNSALFLDIDGTLLDMAHTPEAVMVPDALMEALKTLHGALGGALAFVSGRPLGEIDRLFAPLQAPAIGCHGAQIRGGDGKTHTLTGPIGENARALFYSLAKAHTGTMVEDKIYVLALHYRLAPEARSALEAALEGHQGLFSAENIVLQHGTAVIEAKHSGIDKGVGVRALLQEPPFLGRTPVFGGDDTTDMDVFRILPELGGEGFSVGRRFQGAAYQFPSPQAVRQWLTDLAITGLAA
jgi:trehalose 6-phosphate phosphatase